MFETVEAALFTFLQAELASSGIRKFSRYWKLWPQTGIENQDALYLVPLGANVTQLDAFQLPTYRVMFDLIVYTWASEDRETVPQKRIYELWAAIDAAMRSKPQGMHQTIDGTIFHAWIDGDVVMNAGNLQQQCQLTVPITAKTGI